MQKAKERLDMKKISYQHGFSVIELGIVIVVVTLVGFVGYTALKNFNVNKNTVATQSNSAAPTQSTIKSKTDVQQTIQSLNNDQSDQQLDPTQLDADLSTLL